RLLADGHRALHTRVFAQLTSEPSPLPREALAFAVTPPLEFIEHSQPILISNGENFFILKCHNEIRITHLHQLRNKLIHFQATLIVLTHYIIKSNPSTNDPILCKIRTLSDGVHSAWIIHDLSNNIHI
ncbi:hypothetical protein, partial [Ralstonia solanacearum]